MATNPITSIRRWIDSVVYNRSALDRLSAWELDEKSHEIGKKREQQKEEMQKVKQAYEEKTEKAVDAEGHELKELKAEASTLLDRYERLRRQWAGMLQTQQWLQQMKLGKTANESGVPDIMAELGVDPDNIEDIGKQVDEAVQDEEERARELGFQADKIQEAYQGGGQAMDSISDERVDQAIEAVRQGEGVPEIDTVVDDQPSIDVEPGAMPEGGPE